MPLNTFKTWRQKFAELVPDVELNCGIVIVVVVSCVLSVLAHHFDVSEHLFSLDSNVVIKGHGKRFYVAKCKSQTSLNCFFTC